MGYYVLLGYPFGSNTGRYWLRPKDKKVHGFWSESVPKLSQQQYYSAGIFNTRKEADTYLKRMKNSTKVETRNTFDNVEVYEVVSNISL